ncbi:MAG: divalent-cation tolerance protein CutA [Candidatus Anstonellales archaeon]
MLVAFTTTDKKSVAENIANALISKNIASCVQIISMQSFYLWEGKKQKSKEYLIIIKAKNQNVKIIEKEVKRLSNYELPEFIYFKANASKDYAAWINGKNNGGKFKNINNK